MLRYIVKNVIKDLDILLKMQEMPGMPPDAPSDVSSL